MSIYLYENGDHPAGFKGFRVVVPVGGQYKQKYFSFKKHNIDDRHSPGFEALHEKVKALDKKWNSERIKAREVFKQSHEYKTTKKARGVGFMGITLYIKADVRERFRKTNNCQVVYQSYTAGFRVSTRNNQNISDTLFSINRLGYSEAWNRAVHCWAQHNGYSDSIRDKALAMVPPPSQFKLIRRDMNENGFDIPVSALSSVFSEQRESIKRKSEIRKMEEQLRREIDAFANKREDTICAL